MSEYAFILLEAYATPRRLELNNHSSSQEILSAPIDDTINRDQVHSGIVRRITMVMSM